MSEQKLCDQLLDYFNETLDPHEQDVFEAHLSECGSCQEELQELQMLTEDLPFSAEPIEPNEGMKDRILSNVFAQPVEIETDDVQPNERVHPEKETSPNDHTKLGPRDTARKSRKWIQPLLAASLLLSLGANAYFYMSEEPSDQPNGFVEGTDQIVKKVQLAASEGFNGTAQATMIEKDSGSMALVVQANDLKQLSGTEAYQVWLIDKSGTKFRAGTFLPNEEGAGAVSFPVNYKGEHEWETIAVTLEPTPTSEQPQGAIVLASKL